MLDVITYPCYNINGVLLNCRLIKLMDEKLYLNVLHETIYPCLNPNYHIANLS